MKLLLPLLILSFFSTSNFYNKKDITLSKTKTRVKESLLDDKGTLQLRIQNIQKTEGALRIALFRGQETFLDDTASYKKASAKVDKNKVGKVTFTDLPYGVYALAIYHDVNNNGKLDKSFVGIPKEPYGFSNNARSKWGPPKYEIAQFEISQPIVEMEVAVKVWSKQ